MDWLKSAPPRLSCVTCVISHLLLKNQLQNLNELFLCLKLKNADNWSVPVTSEAGFKQPRMLFSSAREWFWLWDAVCTR